MISASRPGAYAQIRIREPAGERTFGTPLTIGGEGADIVVPGVDQAALTIERHHGEWIAMPQPGASVRFDGRPLATPRELRRNDVLSVGDAQLDVADVSRTLLRLEVHHLVGNETIAPVAEVAALGFEGGDEELEIHASIPVGKSTVLAADAAPVVEARVRTARSTPRLWTLAAAAAVALLMLSWLVSTLESVSLDVRPADARVSTPGSWVSLRVGDRLFLLPGAHTVRAQRNGYSPAQVSVNVADGGASAVRLRLAKLPGRLNIDTQGIAAMVSIDGVEVGRAPGEVAAPAGERTVTLRAPRYLDYVTTLEVEGAGARQELEAALQPSWGTLEVSATPTAARVGVDGRESGAVPAAIEVPSGVHRVQISAPGFKTWESSVVVKAGETLAMGPITLGQPDAQLNVRSRPARAEVSVAGTFRGRTPLTVELPAGIAHDVVVSLPGHESWRRSVFAESGKSIALDARLTPVLARVTVQGTPSGAELWVDGTARGQTPRSLDLTAVEHQLEVRKAGFLPFTTAVTVAQGLERVVEYRLTSADPALALLESAPTITTQTGYVLKLIPGGTFTMGSERREQGRRPNEGLRQVTLKRPFYLGVTEVTNAEFRKFRSGHASGYIGKQSLDLDQQAVSQVTWHDAAEYCNWLSEREGLPPAYERRDGKYWLKRPVTAGYRLPTEAEWEYAARRASANRLLRFAWGDTLPIAPQTGNLAGAEAEALVEARLPGYGDDYVVVAPVGKFKPNALGLHDLTGNVSEWVNDFYLSFVDSTAVTDPLGPEQAGRHVVRGANWRSAAVTELRLAWRDSADALSPTIGFRVARYAQ